MAHTGQLSFIIWYTFKGSKTYKRSCKQENFAESFAKVKL